MNIDDVISQLEKLKKIYGNALCYLIGDYVASDTLDFIKVYGVNKVVFFNKRNDWTKCCEERVTFEKRIENLEKVYLMLQDDVDKKLEMLRENNNLFAEEIKRLGGFQEDKKKSVPPVYLVYNTHIHSERYEPLLFKTPQLAIEFIKRTGNPNLKLKEVGICFELYDEEVKE